MGEWLPYGCGGGGGGAEVWVDVGLPAPATRLWEASRETGGLFSWGGGGVIELASVGNEVGFSSVGSRLTAVL